MHETDTELTDAHAQTLLKTARAVIEAAVTGTESPQPQAPCDPALQRKCGCFVTLHVAGNLRGCIGTFCSDAPICTTVIDMATAALRDPRFVNQPIRPNELQKLTIEISVLSPLQRSDDPMSLQLGKHGVYIKKGYQTGCFLPQVATEAGWDTQQFLSYCCSHKAGLPADAWKDASTEVYLFTAQVFSEQGGRR